MTNRYSELLAALNKHSRLSVTYVAEGPELLEAIFVYKEEVKGSGRPIVRAYVPLAIFNEEPQQAAELLLHEAAACSEALITQHI